MQPGSLFQTTCTGWARRATAYRQLTRLPAVTLSASATSQRAGDMVQVHVHLQNPGTVAALENKLTLLNASGSRILPAYYSDNYVSVLPGETHDIEVDYPASAANGAPHLELRGWNLSPVPISISAQK